MKNTKIISSFFGLLFLLLDQFLKWQALYDWNAPYLLNKFFGWQPFLNPGIAFGIPLPNWLIILITIPIILLLAIIFFTKKYTTYNTLPTACLSGRQGRQVQYPISFIIFGAFSNLIDRLVFGYTVDYLQIFTGVINLADVMIVAGFLLILIRNIIYTSEIKTNAV